MSTSSTTLDLWSNLTLELKKILPSELYDMWFEGLTFVSESGNRLTISAPNDFNAIWIENNYLDVIAQKARDLSGRAVSIQVEVDSGNSAEGKESDKIEKDARNQKSGIRGNSRDVQESEHTSRFAPKKNKSGALLNPRNTFDNLVVGSGNQLAHAARMQVAIEPGQAYHPLLVSSEPG